MGATTDPIEKLNRAKTAHKEMVQDLYSPLKQRVQELPGLIKNKEKEMKEEDAGKKVSGVQGKGERYGQLEKEKEGLDAERTRLETTLKNSKPYFEQNLENKTPEEIREIGRQALETIPSDLLAQNTRPQWLRTSPERLKRYQDPQLLQNIYTDPDAAIDFLTPYNKIIKGDGRAIFAGTIALMVDGVIIMLAIASDKKKFKETRILSPQISGSEIIDLLRRSITNGKIKILDPDNIYSQLRQQLVYLFDAMKNCGWVRLASNSSAEGEWEIVTEQESELMHWLARERHRQIDLEGTGRNRDSNGYLTFLFPDEDTNS